MYNRRGKSKFSLKCHLIFVVKYRHPLLKHNKISNTIKETILAAQTKEFTVDTMEVDVDHIHLLIDYVPQISITQIVRKLKQMTATDIWKVVDLKKYLWARRHSGLMVTLFAQLIKPVQKPYVSILKTKDSF